MIALSGQLGNAALGSFQLGRAPVYGEFVPHRGRPRATLRAATVSATIRRGPTVRSTIRASSVRSEVSDG